MGSVGDAGMMHEEYILYHSTFDHNLSTIQMFGLIAGSPPLWEEWSEPGYVYFETTPGNAYSWSVSYAIEHIVKSEFDRLYPYMVDKWDTKNSLRESSLKKIELAKELIAEGIVILESELPRDVMENDYGTALKIKRNVPPDRIKVYKMLDREEFIKDVITAIKTNVPGTRWKRPKTIRTDREWIDL
jgi:hypothetical protein